MWQLVYNISNGLTLHGAFTYLNSSAEIFPFLQLLPGIRLFLCFSFLILRAKPCIFKVAYGTVHNAYSSLDDEFSMANNFRSLDAALEHGVRALMLGDIRASYVCRVYCRSLIRDCAVTQKICGSCMALLELTLSTDKHFLARRGVKYRRYGLLCSATIICECAQAA